MFKPGKLYRCSEYFLLIYPTKEKALHAVGSAGGRRNTPQQLAAAEATYWSRELKCQVRYSEPGEIFMFLEQDGDFLRVLFGENQAGERSGPTLGWIANREYLGIVEAEK